MGVILGTAAYMAPEQAKGQPVDHRADLWAFGVVLLEMLTGQQVFPGPTVGESLAKVLERGPDLDALPGVQASAKERSPPIVRFARFFRFSAPSEIGQERRSSHDRP